ncbi:MAG: class I SAM-dependent methyltransferase [Tepidisphaeraceae bacterium]
MNKLLHGVVRSVAESFDLPQPIIEVGSYQVEGQHDIIELRHLFPGKKYIGMDFRTGPGVDITASVEELPLADNSVGTIIAMSTFEHVRHFWRGFAEVQRVLKPGGAFLLSTPFYFYIHNYPADYWRFTPQAFEILLEDFPQRIFGWHGTPKRPENVWSLAFKEGGPPVSPPQFERYKSLLGQYANQPLRPWRVARYKLASLFVGRGPFANYLDQSRWETELRTAPARA